MIDTARVTMPMTAKLRNCLREASTLEAPNIKTYNGKYFFVKSACGGKSIRVYFDIDTRVWGFECSLPKLIQGHNVCGSNKLELLCLEAVKYIYDKLGLTFDRSEQDKIRKKRIKLSRVDLACNFVFSSMHEAQKVIEEIANNLTTTGVSWAIEGKDGVETTYARKYSRRVTDKFYLKGKEVERRKLPAGLEARVKIYDLARRSLRFEVTYRSMELKRIGGEFGRDLQYADQWSTEVVKQLLRERIERFSFSGSIRESLESESLTGLSKPAQTFYDLYEQGANLRQKRSYVPLRRAREEILAHGVDIFRARGTERKLDLAELLSGDRVKFSAPKSLVKSGAVILFRNRALLR